MLDKLRTFIRPFVNLIYPDLCVACDEEHPIENSCFCIGCLNELPFTKLHDERDNVVEKHFWGRLLVEKGTALFYFHKGELVQEMIHRLKYKNEAFVGDALGLFFGEQLINTSFLDNVDLILPIPIHKSKRKTRDYNQSALIAKGIAKHSGIEWSDSIIAKTSKSSSQTEKNREERLENLKNTFQVAKPEQIRDKHVLIIDDILTTGATLEAVGSVLATYNTKLSIAVLAVGQY